MDTQIILAVLGTAAGVMSAYYAYLQHQKSRNTNKSSTSDTSANSSAPKQTRLWSTAVDQAIENFHKGRRDCQVEITEQKTFDKPVDRFSTSELILHVKYLDAGPDAGEGEAASVTHRFELKINKDGDILEMQSKGKRSTDREKFR